LVEINNGTDVRDSKIILNLDGGLTYMYQNKARDVTYYLIKTQPKKQAEIEMKEMIEERLQGVSKEEAKKGEKGKKGKVEPWYPGY